MVLSWTTFCCCFGHSFGIFGLEYISSHISSCCSLSDGSVICSFPVSYRLLEVLPPATTMGTGQTAIALSKSAIVFDYVDIQKFCKILRYRRKCLVVLSVCFPAATTPRTGMPYLFPTLIYGLWIQLSSLCSALNPI